MRPFAKILSSWLEGLNVQQEQYAFFILNLIISLIKNSVIGLVLWHGENYEMDFKLINEWALKNQVKVKLFFAHEEDKNKLENL